MNPQTLAASALMLAGCLTPQAQLRMGYPVECGYTFQLVGVSPGECWTVEFDSLGSDDVGEVTGCYPDAGGVYDGLYGSYTMTVWEEDRSQSWGPTNISCDPSPPDDETYSYTRPVTLYAGDHGDTGH